MIHAKELLPLQSMKSAIANVFHRRETPFVYPIIFSEPELNTLQGMWNRYLQGIRKEDREHLPLEIRQLLDTFNAWLVQVVNVK
jgi:hypothetical protein